jgi:glycosyltransferase involved in cell wall biosynthesis
MRLWGVKKISVHDHTPGERTKPEGLKKEIKGLIQRTPFLTADHYIAVTDYVYNRFIEVSCIPQQKCSVATNGIIPINLKSVDTLYAHNEFNIPDDCLIIVSTGRATYYKGIDFYIECANKIINYYNLAKFHFLFCGDGPDLNSFKSLVQKYGLERNFTFTGNRSDIRCILPSCNIGFHASHGEVGYSLSILEYMSAGLATIVPDSPSTSGATRDMETGILYRHGDIESACHAIKRCLSKDLRDHLSIHAIETVSKDFNISETIKKLITILEKEYTPTNE